MGSIFCLGGFNRACWSDKLLFASDWSLTPLALIGLYTDESPGLKVDPVVVLVLSLGFIFSVVALHSTSLVSPLLNRPAFILCGSSHYTWYTLLQGVSSLFQTIGVGCKEILVALLTEKPLVIAKITRKFAS